MFDTKDFEYLHRDKIKNGLLDYPLTAQYFFCYKDKLLFIKKTRKHYKLMSSSQCNFQPVFRESCFDVLDSSEDLEKIKELFRIKVYEVITDELYKSV